MNSMNPIYKCQIKKYTCNNYSFRNDKIKKNIYGCYMLIAAPFCHQLLKAILR